MNFAKLIDHTLLKQDTTKEEIINLCNEAAEYHFASVCINPFWVKTAAEILHGSDVKVCTVIGFPLGASTTETKTFETKEAIKNGASEIDMVINIGALKDGNSSIVKEDIQSVIHAAKGHAIVKVIIETCLLTEEEKILAAILAVEAGADFVKTSTGFSTGGATVQDVKLLRKTVGPEIGVKASGGIRSKEDMLAMTEAGANRIGASSDVKLMQGLVSDSDY